MNVTSELLSADTCKRIANMVELSRAARRAPTDGVAAQAEVYSVQSATRKLFEHAVLNHMEPEYISFTYETSNSAHLGGGGGGTVGARRPRNELDSWSDAESGSEDDDGDEERSTQRTRRADSRNKHYTLVVAFKDTEESSKIKSPAIEVKQRAHTALVSCFAALNERKRGRQSVEYDDPPAVIYDAKKNLYELTVILWPPRAERRTEKRAVDGAHAAKRRKAPNGNAVRIAPAQLVDEDACVQFYASKPHLWAAFGHSVDELSQAVLKKK